jgi:hypothetical protein
VDTSEYYQSGIAYEIFEPTQTRNETISEVLEDNIIEFYKQQNYSHLTFHSTIDTTPWNWYTKISYIFFSPFSFKKLFKEHYHIPPVSEFNYQD